MSDERGTYQDGYEDGYDDGHRDGYDEAERELEPEGLVIRDAIARAGFNELEAVAVRWDAPLRAWVLVQGGREVLIREET